MDAWPDDRILARRAKEGHLEAFEALVARHERAVFSLALRITRHQHDAEDVTQEAILSAMEHLADFREEARFGTWIRRIATHAALKVLRKRKGLPSVQFDDGGQAPDGGGFAHPEVIADWSQSPEHLVQLHETRTALEAALATLDDKHRVVFVLRDVEGFSVRETAEMLELSEANVKVRLLRARLQLREELTRAFGDPARRIVTHPHADAPPEA
jgi:RNA polymerase sigma-70 factor (ECF subfamily)